MFRINAHTLPTIDSSEFRQAKGAYAVIYINYADIDGAYELARFYIEESGWIVEEMEDEYYKLESPEDVDPEHLSYYKQALEEGYSIIYYCYENDDITEEDT